MILSSCSRDIARQKIVDTGSSLDKFCLEIAGSDFGDSGKMTHV